MALPIRSLEEILDRGLAHFRASLRGYPLGTKKFLGRVARAASLIAWGTQKAVEDLDRDIVPSAQSSTESLSAWADTVGLTDGEGGFGRLKPTTAAGGIATLTGVLGTVFPEGSIATAEDGETQIELLDEVEIAGTPPGYGSIEGQFVALTAGTVGNLPVSTICTWDAPPAGADASFTLTSPLAGGSDTESNPEVFARLRTRLQTPPRGGVEEDFREWAMVEEISEVYVYPLRSGTGTVDVVIMQAGSGEGRVPSETQRAAAEANIAENRPSSIDGVNVLVPIADVSYPVRVRVVPAADRFDFDWDDGGSYLQVDTAGYTAGPPAQITLTGLAPDSLKDAIDAFIAGTSDAPRLQVLSSGAVINEPIRAEAYADGGGKTTLDLETLPDGWTAPTDGDKLYAYGPVVATIAANILAFVDSLGPSNVSGFQDPNTPWEDTLTISGIIATAENAIDTDGTKLIQKVPVGYATIDGVAADVQPDDSAGTPEVIVLNSIAVTS